MLKQKKKKYGGKKYESMRRVWHVVLLMLAKKWKLLITPHRNEPSGSFIIIRI